MLRIKGLATGIGSLPYQNADDALDLIFRYIPKIPFWPQLPKRDAREGMVVQFSECLPCLKVKAGSLVFSPEEKDKELEIFYERIIGNDIEYFKISRDYSFGIEAFYRKLYSMDLEGIEFIKCHITGPFTFAASIKDEKGVVLLHDPVFMQAIIKGLVMKALWQVKFLKDFGKKIIIFIDEPYLGCFGSAYTPINKEGVVKGLRELTEGIKSQDVLLGIHCCGNTDWSLFTGVNGLDIINFDAFGFLDKFVLYAQDLNGFLERGGIICWGIVPTQDFSEKETVESLSGKIKKGIDILSDKNVNRNLLLGNLLISPSCGLGTLDLEKPEKIFRLLSDVSSFLEKE